VLFVLLSVFFVVSFRFDFHLKTVFPSGSTDMLT
jgi:hypothetical protein